MSVKEELAGNFMKAWGVGILAWLLPGLGHLYLRCFIRGAVLGGVIWLLFLVGLATGGRVHGLMDSGSGFLTYIFGFFDLGAGLLYLVSRMMGIGALEQDQIATAEYGNVFIMVSGLLNYLLALDVFDIAAGRKK